MLFSVLYGILLIVINCTSLENSQEVNQYGIEKKYIYHRFPYDTKFNVVLNRTTEQVLDFTEDSDEQNAFPSRFYISSDDALDSDYPLFITAQQQKGISSWELPLIIQSNKGPIKMTSMERTLCPLDSNLSSSTFNRPTLELTTSKDQNVSVDIEITRVTDFYVDLDKEIQLVVTPNTPKFYYFGFGKQPWNNTQLHGFLPKFNYTVPKSVILVAESDDDLCAVVSVQNSSCPVYDTEDGIMRQGYYLTMSTKGGITLMQSSFPVGFYVVFIVKETDEQCTGMKDGPSVKREKTIRFRIIPTISYKEYLTGALTLLAGIFAFYIFIVSLTYVRCGWCDRDSSSGNEEERPTTSAEQPILYDTADGSNDNELSSALPAQLTVACLWRSQPAAQHEKTERYFWNALTVALVYALPVVQLLVTYQYMVHETGSQDMCYYNFLCAHPLGRLTDANHVFSNIGYVVLGAGFAAQVRRRQWAERGLDENLGVPPHYGLLYSMALALMMEGVLSACYHLCPNKMNFQFDSTFMYVMAALCCVKLYASRHADLHPRAHTTFILIACVMAIGVMGIMHPTLPFWAAFTALHLGACLLLTLKIYYLGRFKFEWALFGRAWQHLLRPRSLAPRYAARFVLLALAAAANVSLAAYGIYEHNKDFARHLLAILMGNTILYTVFYVAMKLVHRERVLASTWLYFALTHALWFVALWLFMDSKTKWSQTPAQSRSHNGACGPGGLWDSHDAWHVASGAALLAWLQLLLDVDRPLRAAPRHTIPVF